MSFTTDPKGKGVSRWSNKRYNIKLAEMEVMEMLDEELLAECENPLPKKSKNDSAVQPLDHSKETVNVILSLFFSEN